jgi:tRNA modification GTPase
MHFTHRPYQQEETIAAVATPPGEGGIAVIRISGKEALSVAEKIYAGPIRSYKSHTAHFGKIVSPDGHTLDEVLILPMFAPRSYTGEDTVEIHCHGGSLITRQVLDIVIAAGARAALPGEFTFRAYINGKLDLVQAEAVQSLIGAKNERALKEAHHQLQGALSKKVMAFQKELIDIASIIEAWVDFPEEGLEFASLEEILDSLGKIAGLMENLSQTFHEGKILNEGLNLCLVGTPNVGKSSLMNALLGKERAIVTDIPGTTRDVLEGDLRLGGLHFNLLDTAGIRQTDERVEQEGIRRSKQALETADLVLLILDASRGILPEDKELIDLVNPEKTIVVWNKIDLPYVHPQPEGAIALSAREGQGLTSLREAIDQMIWREGPPSKEDVLITNVRHKQALDAARGSLTKVIEGLKTGVSPEFLTADLRQALAELGLIIGMDITEDILTAIFSKFCVGK